MSIFQSLFDVIEDRKTKSPDKSYVASLMAGGSEKINKKITEEAFEVCEAALENNTEHLVHEICDLLFHTFVQAGYHNISLAEIEGELEKRFGIGGFEEKAGRTKK